MSFTLIPAGKPARGTGTGLRVQYPRKNPYPHSGYGFLAGTGAGMASDTRGFTRAVPYVDKENNFKVTAVLVYVDSRVVFFLYITQTGISLMLGQFHNSFISYRVAMPSKPVNKEAPLNLMLEDDTISLDEEDFHHRSAILDALDQIDVDEDPDADDQQ
jgi:hypothetical protein